MKLQLAVTTGTEECDNCEMPIATPGIEVNYTCPDCKTVHRLHPGCLSDFGIEQLGGRDVFETLLRAYTARWN